MFKLILSLVIILVFHPAFAQKNYESATIVTTGGETIAGEIDYKEWKQNPDKIFFRKNKATEGRQYGVNDLESFSVAGDVYRRAVVDITERSDNLGSLSYDADSLVVRNDTVFLQTIVSGPKSLYSFTDNVNHFYIHGKNGFEFLAFAKILAVSENVITSDQSTINNNNKFVVTKKGYIAQLQEYLKECSGISFAGVNYDEASLRKAFMTYYDCVGSKPEHIQKVQKEKVEIGLLAGISNTTFKVNSQNNEIIGRVPFSSSVGPAAGVFFDMVFPRQRGKISWNNELMYSSYATEGTYRYNESQSTYDDYSYHFEYSYIKLNTMLRYKFLTSTVNFFVNGGVSNGFVLTEVNTLNKVHSFLDQKISRNYTGFDQTRKYELGILVGAGAKRNRLSIEVRAERGGGPFHSSTYKAEVMRYSALLGYRVR